MDEAIRAWVEQHVGPTVTWVDRSWPHGVTSVWRVALRAEVVWVKVHTDARKFGQEDRAYREVAPQLAAVGVRVPSRIASDGARTLLLTHLAGEPARFDDPAIHHRAGEALAVLHALPFVDADPLPLADALRARLARWVRAAEGVLPAARIAEAVAGFGDGPAMGARVWCHRDWSARNWLVDGGRLGVLDFEHAAPDGWMLDLPKLVEVAFGHPGVEDAFFAGYARRPPPEELRRLLWLTTLATVVWAREHGDQEYEAVGEALWRRLRGEL